MYNKKKITKFFFILVGMFTVFVINIHAQPDPQSEAFRASLAASYNQTGHPVNKSESSNSGSSGEQVGSSSFNMSVDLLNLSQRGGNLNLQLNYNSGVWNKIKMSQTQNGYIYDILHGFPSPGFNLGFPKVLVHSYAGGVVFVDPDDTRHLMIQEQPSGNPFGSGNYHATIDGTYIKLVPAETEDYVTAHYPNGTRIEFRSKNIYNTHSPGASVYQATKIIYPNGNFISINYTYFSQVEEQKLASIVDTMGRSINFHYNLNADLIAITMPNFENGTKQIARFYYKTITRYLPHSSQIMPFSTKVLSHVYFPPNSEGYRYYYSDNGYGMVHKYAKVSGMSVSTLDLENQGNVVQEGLELFSKYYDYPLAPQYLNDTPSYTHRYDDWMGRLTEQPIYTYSKDEINGISTVTDPDGFVTETTVKVNEGEADDGLVLKTTVKKDSRIIEVVENEWEPGFRNVPENFPPTNWANFRLSKIIKRNEANLTSQIHFNYIGCNSLGFNNVCEETAYGYSNNNEIGPQLKKLRMNYVTSQEYKNKRIVKLPSENSSFDSIGSLVSKTEIKYDETEYSPIYVGEAVGWTSPNSSAIGYPTTYKSWLHSPDQTESWVLTHTQRDNFGNIRKMWDAKGNMSEIYYSPIFLYAYPTSFKSPSLNNSEMRFEEAANYDFNTGLTLSETDINGQTIQMSYRDPITNQIDPLWRLRKVTAPNGQQTISEYGEWTSDATRFQKVKTQIDDTKWAIIYTWFDALGREFKSQKVEATGDVFVDTQYDKMGRISKSSNPYRENEEKIWTEYLYDELKRPWKTILHGSNSFTTTYGFSVTESILGTSTTIIDQAGKKRRSITNAIGQVIRVDEPNNANDLGDIATPTQPTNYTYNTVGNLVKVSQGQQNRFFLYDSLGRLIRVRQPEQNTNSALNLTDPITGNSNWSTASTYDANGNSLTTTDAKGVIISQTYDALNRPLVRSYSDGTPTVTNTYDGANIPNSKGQLTKISSSISTTENTAFDIVGKVLSHKQITDGQTYNTAYSYNLSGALIEETYPSGRIVKNILDNDGRLAAVSSKTSAQTDFRNYASNFVYAASGAVTQMRYGNGRWESAQFNSRLQITQIGLGTSQNTTNLWKTKYDYGEIDANDNLDTNKNNGSVARQTTSFSDLATPFVQSYKYDSLQRLTEAKEMSGTTQTFKQNFGYDRFGNRTSFSQLLGTTQTNQTPTIDPTNNRFTTGQGFTYDFDGNLIADSQGRQFTFNGDNKQTQVKDANNVVVGSYFYDGTGARVKKITTSETTIFVYNAGGKLVAEYSTQTASNPTISYTTSDNLGSPRVITDNGGNVSSRRDFMAFGEELNANSTANRTANAKYTFGEDNVRKRFTGYEKDQETGLDFAEARYYNNQHGRFTAVDPLLASGKSANPQTFNRYVYVTNNPVNMTDPTGLFGVGGNGQDNLSDTGFSNSWFSKDEFESFSFREWVVAPDCGCPEWIDPAEYAKDPSKHTLWDPKRLNFISTAGDVVLDPNSANWTLNGVQQLSSPVINPVPTLETADVNVTTTVTIGLLAVSRSEDRMLVDADRGVTLRRYGGIGLNYGPPFLSLSRTGFTGNTSTGVNVSGGGCFVLCLGGGSTIFNSNGFQNPIQTFSPNVGLGTPTLSGQIMIVGRETQPNHNKYPPQIQRQLNRYHPGYRR